MSLSDHSVKTLRTLRSNSGRFSIIMRGNKIVDSHPHGVRQNTIRALRKYGYVSKLSNTESSNTITYELTRKAYDYLDEIEWTPVPVRSYHAAY